MTNKTTIRIGFLVATIVSVLLATAEFGVVSEWQFIQKLQFNLPYWLLCIGALVSLVSVAFLILVRNKSKKDPAVFALCYLSLLASVIISIGIFYQPLRELASVIAFIVFCSIAFLGASLSLLMCIPDDDTPEDEGENIDEN